MARSSAEAEFRAIAHGICEVIWVKRILEELKSLPWEGIRLYCDNKSAITIAQNPVQNDRTKHVEIDRHFIKENIEEGIIIPLFVRSSEQVADIFTKGLPNPQFHKLSSKLGMTNIHTQLAGGY